MVEAAVEVVVGALLLPVGEEVVEDRAARGVRERIQVRLPGGVDHARRTVDITDDLRQVSSGDHGCAPLLQVTQYPAGNGRPLLGLRPGPQFIQQNQRKRPGLIEPCIPTLASRPPTGPQWVHEIKHDGYRLIARKQNDRVRLFTRRGYDWTDRYPLIRKAVEAIRTASAVIDGEAVCCDAGVAAFEKRQPRP